MDSSALDQRIKSWHEHSDVEERLEELQNAVALLRQRQEQQASQWKDVSMEQRQHCSDLASMYQQLQELLTGSWSVGPARRSMNVTSVIPAVSDGSLKIEVRDLLLNFKTHIERHSTLTNQRLDSMQKTIDDIRLSVEDDARLRVQLEERVKQLERQNKELLERVSSTPWIRDTDRLHDTLNQRLQLVRDELEASVQRHLTRISDRLENHEVHHRDEQESRHSDMLQTVENAIQQLHGRLDIVRQELVSHVSSTDTNVCMLEERMQSHIEGALKDHVAKTGEGMQEMHRELSEKHLRLVDDTMKAIEQIAQVADGLPRKVVLLQEDVAVIRDSIQRQSEVLKEHCLQGSLQGAFDEVKDWLQDLEQRMLNRGEFDEVMARIEDKIFTLKQEFIIRSPVTHALDDRSEDQHDNDAHYRDRHGGAKKR